MNYPALKGGASDFSLKNLSLERKLLIVCGFIPCQLRQDSNFALKGGVLHPHIPIKFLGGFRGTISLIFSQRGISGGRFRVSL
jgi:hypothetical protein